MKKIFSILLALTLLPSVGMIASAERDVDQYHVGIVVADEDFEDLKLDAFPGEGWEADTYSKNTGVYADVAIDPLDPDNQALKIVKDSGGLVWTNKTFEPINGEIVISYRVMLTSSEVVHYLGYMNGIQNLMTYQGGWVWGTYTTPNSNTELNKWHEIRWELDFNEQSYRGYINGALSRESSFSAPLDNLTKIGFGHAASWMWIDDLKISYTPGSTINYTKIVVNDPEYVYNHSLKGIYNIAPDTEVGEFLSNITFVDGAVYGIYEKDGVTPYTKRFIENFATLKIKAPDGSKELNLVLHPHAWIASANTVRTSYNCITLFENDYDMLVKNKKVFIENNNKEVTPYLKDGKLFVPLRALAEGFGMNVGWDAKTAMATVNGVKVDCYKETKFGRTFISAEDASRILNKKLFINEDGIATFAGDGVEIDEKAVSTFKIEIQKRKRVEKEVEV